MAKPEETPKTDPQPPTGTSTPPTAPEEPKPGEATPPSGSATDSKKPKGGDDETITLSKKDYNNLISQRDKNSGAQSFLNQLAQERYIDDFLTDNKDKFPDLTRADLLHVSDLDEFDTEAARIQSRLQKHAQAKILEIETPTPPRLSAEERSAKEKQLKESNDPNAFQKMVMGRL